MGHQAAHAQAVTTQLWLPFPSTAVVNGETVGFSGAVRVVAGGSRGAALVPVLQLTGVAELLYGAGLLVGLLLDPGSAAAAVGLG